MSGAITLLPLCSFVDNCNVLYELPKWLLSQNDNTREKELDQTGRRGRVQQMDDGWVQSVLCANFSYIRSTLHRAQQWQTIDWSLSSGYSLHPFLRSALKPNNNLFSLQATASPLPAQSTSYFVIPFQPAAPYQSRCTTSNTENIRSAALSWNDGFQCRIKSPAVGVTWCLCQ